MIKKEVQVANSIKITEKLFSWCGNSKAYPNYRLHNTIFFELVTSAQLGVVSKDKTLDEELLIRNTFWVYVLVSYHQKC